MLIEIWNILSILCLLHDRGNCAPKANGKHQYYLQSHFQVLGQFESIKQCASIQQKNHLSSYISEEQ